MTDELPKNPMLDALFQNIPTAEGLDPALLMALASFSATQSPPSPPKTGKRSRHRERDSSAVCFAFFAPYVWRDEIDALGAYVSEIRGAPPSRSETMRTALRLGMDQLRRQQKRSPSRRHEGDPLFVEPPVEPTATPSVPAEAKPTPGKSRDVEMWKGPIPKDLLARLPPDVVRKPNFRLTRQFVEDFLENG